MNKIRLFAAAYGHLSIDILNSSVAMILTLAAVTFNLSIAQIGLGAMMYQIVAAMSRSLTVRYKGPQGSFRDPVSEVDRGVEVLIRARLATEYPTHDILGEEILDRPGSSHDVVWAIDPLDGTSNFVNGFPMFSATIGVLAHGRPVVGATWCSTSHLLRPGVYHASLGGPLCFDGQPVLHPMNPTLRRRLAGEPGISVPNAPWDMRKTGSAALECAFAAVGLLQFARFASPNIWDVAGGLALARAAGRAIMVRERDRWREFRSFGRGTDADKVEVMRDWRRPLIVGEPVAVAEALRLQAATQDPA